METFSIEDDNGKFYYIKYDNDPNHQYYHRLDGPAQEWNDGDEMWYINGYYVRVTCQEDFEKSIPYREWNLKAFK
jgi:hypothetical protein